MIIEVVASDLREPALDGSASRQENRDGYADQYGTTLGGGKLIINRLGDAMWVSEEAIFEDRERTANATPDTHGSPRT